MLIGCSPNLLKVQYNAIAHYLQSIFVKGCTNFILHLIPKWTISVYLWLSQLRYMLKSLRMRCVLLAPPIPIAL